MSLLKHLSTSLSRSSLQPQFHVPHFKKVIDALLTCPPSERGGKKRSTQEAPPVKLDAEVRDQFVAKWLNVHADVRWFLLRDAECDFFFSFCSCHLSAINKAPAQPNFVGFLSKIESTCSRKPSFPSREVRVLSGRAFRLEGVVGRGVAN